MFGVFGWMICFIDGAICVFFEGRLDGDFDVGYVWYYVAVLFCYGNVDF